MGSRNGYNPLMHSAPDRVIHVTLSEEDWKAFLASQPRPVEWIRERIKEAIATARSQTPDAKRQLN